MIGSASQMLGSKAYATISEGNFIYQSAPSSLEIEFLSEPEAHCFWLRLLAREMLGSALSPSAVLRLQKHAAMPRSLHGCWGFKLMSLRLQSKRSYPLSLSYPPSKLRVVNNRGRGDGFCRNLLSSHQHRHTHIHII